MHSERRTQASKLLSAVAQKLQSPRLATLAVRVRLDAFTRVKKAIDDMVACLSGEAWCPYSGIFCVCKQNCSGLLFLNCAFANQRNLTCTFCVHFLLQLRVFCVTSHGNSSGLSRSRWLGSARAWGGACGQGAQGPDRAQLDLRARRPGLEALYFRNGPPSLHSFQKLSLQHLLLPF